MKKYDALWVWAQHRCDVSCYVERYPDLIGKSDTEVIANYAKCGQRRNCECGERKRKKQVTKVNKYDRYIGTQIGALEELRTTVANRLNMCDPDTLLAPVSIMFVFPKGGSPVNDVSIMVVHFAIEMSLIGLYVKIAIPTGQQIWSFLLLPR